MVCRVAMSGLSGRRVDKSSRPTVGFNPSLSIMIFSLSSLLPGDMDTDYRQSRRTQDNYANTPAACHVQR